jgi:hypothetical protein
MAVRLSALRTGLPLSPQEDSRVDPSVIVLLEGLGQLKNLMTSSGIESATFRLVAQCLNKLRYSVTLPAPVRNILRSLQYNTYRVSLDRSVGTQSGLYVKHLLLFEFRQDQNVSTEF